MPLPKETLFSKGLRKTKNRADSPESEKAKEIIAAVTRGNTPIKVEYRSPAERHPGRRVKN